MPMDHLTTEVDLKGGNLPPECSGSECSGSCSAGCSGTETAKEEQKQPCSGVAVNEGGGPVDGAELLDELAAIFRKHLILPEGGADTAALWTILTQAHDAFQHSPILAFLSPVYGCGKTRALEIINGLTRSEMFSHVTTASIFRFIEDNYGVCLLFDDGEGYIRGDNGDMMSILDSGHARAGARVLRCDGEAHKPKAFDTWTPKAIGKVGALPPSLQTRSIILKMKRKRKVEWVADPKESESQRKELAKKITQWASHHRGKLSRIEPEIPSFLYNRARDNWKPLLAIAEQAGGAWPEKARRAANLLNGAKEDTTEGIMLLADCRVAFGDMAKMSSQALCDTLNNMETRPWGDMNYGTGITTKKLAKLLAPFDIEAKNVRIGVKVPKGYERAQFQDAWDRNLPEGGPTPEFPLQRYSIETVAFIPPAKRYTAATFPLQLQQVGGLA